jgi:hypothetical protein
MFLSTLNITWKKRTAWKTRGKSWHTLYISAVLRESIPWQWGSSSPLPPPGTFTPRWLCTETSKLRAFLYAQEIELSCFLWWPLRITLIDFCEFPWREFDLFIVPVFMFDPRFRVKEFMPRGIIYPTRLASVINKCTAKRTQHRACTVTMPISSWP